MQFPSNQSCCSSNPSVTGWGYSGCGNQYPIIPGSNPALQTWNGQNFVVADGSAQNRISLPFLQVKGGAATYVVGADNNGVWSYYSPNLTPNLSGGSSGQVPWQISTNVTGFTTTGAVGQLLSSNGVSAPTWLNQSSISVGSATTAANISSGVAGSILYQSAPSTTQFTAAGTSGQVLISNGTSAPTWSTNISGNAATATTAINSTNATNATNATTASACTGNSETASAALSGSTLKLTTAKAWVNFDGTTSGTWAGGTSTVTRVAASTTATVTTTNAHGLTTGNTVYALTGVVAGSYVITVMTSTTFTITTVATTALSAVAITFQGSTIQSSHNTSSVTKTATGDYTVNFETAMADANYTVSFGIIGESGSGGYIVDPILNSQSASSFRMETVNGRNIAAGVDVSIVCVQVFGN